MTRRKGAAGAPRRPGTRPEPRTVECTGTGEYADWWMRARADFPASVLAALQGRDVGKVIVALNGIVIEHNMPDATGAIASSMGDVDPYHGMVHMAGRLFDAIGKLPNR